MPTLKIGTLEYSNKIKFGGKTATVEKQWAFGDASWIEVKFEDEEVSAMNYQTEAAFVREVTDA